MGVRVRECGEGRRTKNSGSTHQSADGGSDGVRDGDGRRKRRRIVLETEETHDCLVWETDDCVGYWAGFSFPVLNNNGQKRRRRRPI